MKGASCSRDDNGCAAGALSTVRHVLRPGPDAPDSPRGARSSHTACPKTLMVLVLGGGLGGNGLSPHVLKPVAIIKNRRAAATFRNTFLP